MKTLSWLCLIAGVVTSAVCSEPTVAPVDAQPLRLRANRELPVFPHELVQLGLREGQVRVAFSVDAQGRIEDCLVVAYTHPEFARVSLAAVRRWTFEPARVRGEPVATSSEVTINFEVQGTVVVSLTPMETMATWQRSLLLRDVGYRPRSLRELDRIPTPVSVVTPRYPVELAKKGPRGKIAVQFYIDESGAVRLPSVGLEADADLAAFALSAVREWRFEPPTCGGIPVLVRAEQVFDFKEPNTSR